MANKDFVGLNRGIYDPCETDSGSFGITSNTLGFQESSKSLYWYNTVGPTSNDATVLPLLTMHRNGPYGFPIFKQIRISENHLSRNHKKNNIITVCSPGQQREITVNGKNLLIEERFGEIERFIEPPLVTCYYPININLGQYVGSDDQKYLEKFGLSFDYSNNITYFSDPRLNEILELGELDDDVYEKIKELYLNGALESPNSEISYFEFLRYQQTIFPRQENAFKSYVRTRPNYNNSYWRDLRSSRHVFGSNGFGTDVHQSIWDLDGDINFTTRSGSNNTNASFDVEAPDGWKYTNYAEFIGINPFSNNRSTGILQNNYNHFASVHSTTMTTASVIDSRRKPAPIYARRHTINEASGTTSNFNIGWIALSSSVVNPFSSYATHILNNEPMGPIYQGDAIWEAGRFAKKNPAYDTYGAFFDDLRGLGKDFSTVPEYRMSDFVANYLENGSLVKIDEIFKMEGGLEGSANSSEGTFYKTYSTTDFMRHFAEIKEDHEGFTDPSLITLKCKALKKFLAYDGFYPAQRTVALTEQFDAAYGERIKRYASENDYNYSKQYVYDALFAPGVLYNTMKSGIAVDYPIVSNAAFERTETTNGYLIKSNFDRRIPFESLVDPNNYLNGITFRNNSPEDTAFDGYDKTTYFRRRNAAPLYYKMANNFFAESIDFFLKNGQLTTIYSLPQGSDNFGNFIANDTYGMRVFMNIDSDTAFALYTGNSASFQPPQMTVTGTNGVDFEMYSRPTAFGPPVVGGKEQFQITFIFDSIQLNTTHDDFVLTVNGTDHLIDYSSGTPHGFTGNPPTASLFNINTTLDQARNRLKTVLETEFSGNFVFADGRQSIGTSRFTMTSKTGSPVTSVKVTKNRALGARLSVSVASISDSENTHFDSRDGFNPCHTPPYYYGQCWVDMVFNPKETKKYTISEIINETTASAIRFDSQVFASTYADFNFGPLSLLTASIDGTRFSSANGDLIPLRQRFFANEYASACSSNTFLNINSNQLYSSLNLFGRAIKQDELLEGGTKRITTFSTTELSDPNARWVIQPKFETPMPTFRKADLESTRGYIPTTASVNQANGQTPRGMWHQYGVFAKDGHGVDIGVMDIPNNWLREYNLLAPGSVTADGKMRSLRSALGFVNEDTILGKTRLSKTVREAVVAIPYVEEDTIKKFFQIKENNFQAALNYFKAGDLVSQGIDPSSVGLVNQDFWAAKTSRSVIDQIVKMKRYVLPPVFDAITYDEVTPIAMYIFEFEHTFDRQDILDIWQNLPPKLGESFETAEASISHPLLANELMGGGDGDDDSRTGTAMPDNVRWMVFKVKQKAKTNYYSKIATNSNSFAADFNTEEDPVPFNWPYDFFSLVELIKIDAEIEFSDIDYDVNVEAQDPSESSGDTTSAAVGRRRRVKLKAKRPISREQAKEQSQSLSKKRVRTKNKYKK